MPGIIIFNVFIVASFLTLVRGELTVTQVQVLFRHGERTPRQHEFYPRDIYNESDYEPWGLGQLTNAGKMREYQVGQMLRTRYQELLGTVHLPHDVYAVSTDSDRTKMSLLLLLAGLFPPSGVQTWNTELPWIPIPTHSVPQELDIVLKSYLCPEFENAVSQVLQLPEVRAKIAAHNDLFEFLTVETGMNLTEPYLVYEIHNLLDSQKALNLTLPEWCTDEILKQISDVAILQYDIWSYTTEIRRLHGGPIVRTFIENMRLDRGLEKPRKIYLYSAHDDTVSAFLQAQGILENKIPLYGTAVVLEKLEDSDGNRFVKIVLWTGVTEQLITLRIPGCEEICPIERYLQITREVIPFDEEMDCHWRRLSASKLRSIFREKINYN